MNTIPIPSENCPYCRRVGTYCELLITGAPKIKESTTPEKTYLIEIGKKWQDKKIRTAEAYIHHGYICQNR